MRPPPLPTGRARQITAAALAALCLLEGFRRIPYRDIAGIWTDGYGNTHQVVPGKPVEEPQARARLEAHLDVFGQGVLGCLNREPSQGMYDGFLLTTYNIGVGEPGGKRGFCPSSIASRFNAGDDFGACMGILKFNKARIDGVLQPVRGLTNRRWLEYGLCLGGITGHTAQPWRLRSGGAT